MQGCFINGERPESKEQLRQAIEAGESIMIENIQFFGSEYWGPLDKMPDGAMAAIVGPDPFIARDWYMTIRKTKGRVIVS
jgi:hypothetical protein